MSWANRGLEAKGSDCTEAPNSELRVELCAELWFDRLLSEERLPSVGIPPEPGDCPFAALPIPARLLCLSAVVPEVAGDWAFGSLLVPTALLYLSAAAEILAAALLRWLWALFTGCGCKGHFSWKACGPAPGEFTLPASYASPKELSPDSMLK